MARITGMTTTSSRSASFHRVLGSAVLTAAVLLVVLAGASAALAAGGRPGTPHGVEPQGSITTATPVFTWTAAKGAAKYELRVSQGATRLLMKTGIKALSYTSAASLPEGVDLSWQVRARNARGAGPWSASLSFQVRPASSKAITSFGFAQPFVKGVIDEDHHTIMAILPSGTDLTALVATFTTDGASVTVRGTPQASGVTANDFTMPLIYTVTARDGSTQDYWVSVFTLGLGNRFEGGIVGYIFQLGDPGYVAGETHGLIAAAADQSTGTVWSTIGGVPGAGGQIGQAGPGTALGTGRTNTQGIVAQTATIGGQTVTCTGGAAYLCYHLTDGGFTDWFLPSKDELAKLYAARVAIGGFASAAYWSSSDIVDAASGSATTAWAQDFASGVQTQRGKSEQLAVRAVREF